MKTVNKHEEINLHIKKSTFRALILSEILAIIMWPFAYFVFKYFPKEAPTGFHAVIFGFGVMLIIFSPIVVFISIKICGDD